jgi:hypothetical protein
LEWRFIKKGLSHLDAEGVIGFSSAYKGTPESQITPKKTHSNLKSADFSADFFMKE